MYDQGESFKAADHCRQLNITAADVTWDKILITRIFQIAL
jgi:hypothetical protein